MMMMQMLLLLLLLLHKKGDFKAYKREKETERVYAILRAN
jgi:hypothetical protein